MSDHLIVPTADTLSVGRGSRWLLTTTWWDASGERHDESRTVIDEDGSLARAAAEKREAMSTTTMIEAAKRWAEAKRAWAEVFLFYYNQPGRGGKPRTVAEAQAMADVEVDTVMPAAEYEKAKMECQSIHLSSPRLPSE